MNANILNLLNNIVPLKSGNSAVLSKNAAPSGQPSVDEIIASLKTADKNSLNPQKKATKGPEANFTDALRKKLDTEKSNKRTTNDAPEASIQDAACPAYVICEKTEIKTEIIGTEIPEGTESTEEISVKTPKKSLSEDGSRSRHPLATVATAAEPETLADPDLTDPAADSVDTVTAAKPTADAQAQFTAEPTHLRPHEADNQDKPVPSQTQTGVTKTDPHAERPVHPTAPDEQERPQVSERTVTYEAVNNRRLPSNEEISRAAERPASPPPSTSTAAAPQVDNQPKIASVDPKPASETETITAKAAVHKMNVATEQMNTLEPQKPPHSAQKSDSKPALAVDGPLSEEPVASLSTNPAPSAEAHAPKIAPITAQDLSVGRQVQESISSSYPTPGNQQMVIRLDPPELGQVVLRFIEQPDGITGVLHVEKTQTQQEIQQALPEIVQNLQNADINIKKIEVVLQNPQQQSGENSAGQNGYAGQQDAPEQQPFVNSVSYREWLANANTADPASMHRVEITDKSINMLI
jgi:hypothetical protein